MKRINKRALRVLTFSLACLLLLSACGGGGNSGGNSGGSSGGSDAGDWSTENFILNLSTASVGTAYYNIGAGLCNVVQNDLPNVKMTAQVSSGSGENLVNMANGDAEIAIMATDYVYWGSRGGNTELSDAYVDATENMSVLMVLEPMVFICLTQDENTKYQTAEDMLLPGTKLSIGPTGSAQYVGWEFVVKAMGKTFADFDTYQGGHSQQAEALKDNNVDVLANIVLGLSNPNATYAELTVTDDVRFLPISDEIRDKAIEMAPMYTKVTIPAGWTDDNAEEVETLGVRTVVCINKNLSEDLVYHITESIINGLEDLAVIHKTFTLVSKETAATDLPADLHPGAQKYYEENGFDITYLPDVGA